MGKEILNSNIETEKKKIFIAIKLLFFGRYR